MVEVAQEVIRVSGLSDILQCYTYTLLSNPLQNSDIDVSAYPVHATRVNMTSSCDGGQAQQPLPKRITLCYNS